jgi:hypothetical protein
MCFVFTFCLTQVKTSDIETISKAYTNRIH